MTYSDDDLVRMLAKTVGVQGGKDRADAIRAELSLRGVEERSQEGAIQTILGAFGDDAA